MNKAMKSMAGLTVLIGILFLAETFLRGYYLRLVILFGVTSIVALGVAVINGYVNIFSLCFGGPMMAAGYASALLTLPPAYKSAVLHLPLWLEQMQVSFPVAMLCGGIFAMLSSVVLLLPEDPDASALRLCTALRERFGVSVGVLVTDTLGRPWRAGQTGWRRSPPSPLASRWRRSPSKWRQVMAKGPSKARESRVNIVISDKLKGGAEPELPFRMLVMGDYTLKDDKRAIEDRQPIDINKSNFDSVMQSFNLSLDTSVADRISGTGEMPVSLKFGTLKDFRPEAIARQVPQLKNLLELREALKALRPAMGDKAAQKKLLDAIKDPEVRAKILAMIATPEGQAGAAEGGPQGS